MAENGVDGKKYAIGPIFYALFAQLIEKVIIFAAVLDNRLSNAKNYYDMELSINSKS